MFFILLILWILFNGMVTWEIVGFGIVISGGLYWFMCKFLGYSIRKDKMLLRGTPYGIYYIGLLIKEIVKANLSTIRMLLSAKTELEPVLVQFKTKLKTKSGRVLLANSITLTPGTITVSLENDELTVHCLDRDFSVGLENSAFECLLVKIEHTMLQVAREGE